jgi:5-oxoprolinase (ATP-hydrolysing)
LEKKWKIWIDTGGTFTDCLSIDPENNLYRLKLLSSGKLRGTIKSCTGSVLVVSVSWPATDDIFEGYKIKIKGIRHKVFTVVDSDLSSGKISIDQAPGELDDREFELYSGEEAPIVAARLVTKTKLSGQLPELEMRLGSTKGTNALLERNGSPVIFLTTKGHGEMLKIGTQQRPDLFALNVIKPAPIYSEVIEVDERILAGGQIENQLSPQSIEKLKAQCLESKQGAFAIALLNSYKNPEHELQVEELLRNLGHEYVSVSSKLVNEIGILTRSQTTVVNAYLSKTIEDYLAGVKNSLVEGSLKVMTSAGGLVNYSSFLPKDSLLSGPAGGVVGCASIAKAFSISKILSFDMGGTSTDVSRYAGGFDYNFTTEINHIAINSPTLAIETVAAGGGSICSFDGYKMAVGPESAGASPGPACYGNDGPLAITDINLLLGRVDDSNFSIPLNKDAAKKAFLDIRAKMTGHISDQEVLNGFIRIANEKMAEAIRKISIGKGYNPTEYTLLAFGGAGGQHACSIAALLNIQRVLIPYDAGLLSAFGMGKAEIERFVTHQMLKPLADVQGKLVEKFEEMASQAFDQLKTEGFEKDRIYIRNKFVYLRFQGQESTLEVEFDDTILSSSFEKIYRERYGHWIDKGVVEVESLKLIAASKEQSYEFSQELNNPYCPNHGRIVKCFTGEKWEDIPTYSWEQLNPGATFDGPALILSNNSTVYLEHGWEVRIEKGRNALLAKIKDVAKQEEVLSDSAELELFTNRFNSVADDMGAILQRTSFSVNVKDRLDFSCAMLDSEGFLVANAPHIPVHLGSLGVCVRSVAQVLKMEKGDVVITNHPGFGGSHLPDVTLISPVFYEGVRIGYVANRAHHAEIGGKTPGSMPADAKFLGEEGVVIPPTYLVKNNQPRWDFIEDLFRSGPFPSRSVNENLADLNGALASIKTGVDGLTHLCATHGRDKVKIYMKKLLDYSGQSLFDTFSKLKNTRWTAEELLDDGSVIQVAISKTPERILFDFAGTSAVHPGNLNATPAILNSAIIYVLRLMLEEQLPLNEGLMKYVKISVPVCMLSPKFDADPMNCPAVVGGNTETSQRIADTLIKALNLAACSQGTMNNLIFGNSKFGFYETIGGGVGAGNGFSGADAVHQHMTNTKITDPEIMEFRYPVVLEKMGIRHHSGGDGKWKGGDGIVREIRFREDVILTILSQHREQAPFGVAGGLPGKTGRQIVIKSNGDEIELKGIETIELQKGDRIRIETPGGGGYGKID